MPDNTFAGFQSRIFRIQKQHVDNNERMSYTLSLAKLSTLVMSKVQNYTIKVLDSVRRPQQQRIRRCWKQSKHNTETTLPQVTYSLLEPVYLLNARPRACLAFKTICQINIIVSH